MGSPFISRTDLSDYLGRDVTTDDGATIAVDSACEMVRTLSGQDLDQAIETITLDGTGTDALVLPQLPVNSAGTVNLIDSTGGTTNITDYSLTDKGVLLRSRGSACWPYALGWWPEGRQNVEVTYNHGYGTIPEDLRMVALSLASRILIQGVAIQESTGPTSVRYGVNSTDMTPGETAIIQKYRQIG